MLTQSDLKKIEKLLDRVVETKTREVVQEEVSHAAASEFLDIKRFTLRAIIDHTAPLRREMKEMNKEMRLMSSRVHKLEEDQKSIISLIDKEYVELRKRVDRVETHLQLPS